MYKMTDKIIVVEFNVYRDSMVDPNEEPEVLQFTFFPLTHEYLMWRHSTIDGSHYVKIGVNNIRKARELYVRPYLESGTCELVKYDELSVDHDLNARFENIERVYHFPRSPWIVGIAADSKEVRN